jgi:rare lipoprotein A
VKPEAAQAGLRSVPIELPSALLLVSATLLLVLAACSSAPPKPSSGFYQEDGPPDRVPPDLLATVDAVPRDEPLNPYANRPYEALGRSYVPVTSNGPFHQRGIASWYGRQFQGNRTASGEPYDMFAMTAAHRTLPIPSYARVTRVSDGRSVIVRINDRGPFVRDRVIDLSYVAAARLGLAGPGSGEVEVERILPSQIARAASPSVRVPPAGLVSSPARGAGEAGVRVSPETTAVAYAVPPPGSESVRTAPLATLPAADPPVAHGGRTNAPQVAQPGAAHWSVQLGAFKVEANAEALRDRLALLLSSPEASSLPPELRKPRIEHQGGLARVLIGEATQRTVVAGWSRSLERYLARPTTLFSR